MSNIESHPLYQEQLVLEKEMVSSGQALIMRQIRNAVENERETVAPYGVRLLKSAVVPVGEAIEAFAKEALEGKVGRMNVAAKHLRLVNSYVSALISLRAVLDMISRPGRALQEVSTTVGKYIEKELLFTTFEKECPEEWKFMLRLLETRKSHKHLRGMMTNISKHNVKTWQDWSPVTRYHVGMKVVNIIQEVTGFIKIERRRAANGHFTYVVNPTEKCLKFIEKNTKGMLEVSRSNLPTIIPPKPWDALVGGGYYSVQLNFVRCHSKAQYKLITALSPKTAPNVFKAVNHIQAVPWKINTKVLEVLKPLWERGGNMVGLPERESRPTPCCPICGEEVVDPHPCFNSKVHLEKFTWWKAQKRVNSEHNARSLTHRMQVNKIISIAEKFSQYDQIYFPHSLDFRGRVYAVPELLNPQGADYSKCLLTFAEGKPLTPEGEAWLKIHGANCFGVDKVSYVERMQWVTDNHDRILACAASPLDNRWWMDADAPCQFLAFCFEWAEYAEQGSNFISHLPVFVDGSCNGLQIYSLLLKDAVGAEATNVLPGDSPADIYQDVADKVIERLEEYACNGSIVKNIQGDGVFYDEKELAKLLLEQGITRKTTKRQVMVVPYGGKFSSCTEYTEEWFDTLYERGQLLPALQEQRFAAKIFLSKLIWEAIGQVVVAAKDGMRFLQRLAGVTFKYNQAIVWHTPDGFPLTQAYYCPITKQVETKMGDKIFAQVYAVGDSNKLDSKKQKSAFAPNFVHSLDGMVLRKVVNSAITENITSFAFIHDSFGCLSNDMPMLSCILREEFTDVFSTDLLADVREQIQAALPEEARKNLPLVPVFGSLNVESVIDSNYFFA